MPPDRSRPDRSRTDRAPSRRDPPLLRLRVALWHARPLVVLLAVAAAAGWAVLRLAPPPSPGVAVVVTAREVAAGTALTPRDLRVVRVPPGAAPDGALARDDVVGRAPGVALPAGLPLVDAVLEGERFGVDPPPGLVVVPVRLAGAGAAALLRPGDRVDLVAPGDGRDPLVPDAAAAPPPVLAREALVLEVHAPAADGALGLAAASGEVLTVVAVTAEEGRRLAATTAWEVLGAVLVG